MPYRPTNVGNELFYGDAKRAHAELVLAFAELRTRRAVADRYGVATTTVLRWLRRCDAMGFANPEPSPAPKGEAESSAETAPAVESQAKRTRPPKGVVVRTASKPRRTPRKPR